MGRTKNIEKLSVSLMRFSVFWFPSKTFLSQKCHWKFSVRYSFPPFNFSFCICSRNIRNILWRAKGLGMEKFNILICAETKWNKTFQDVWQKMLRLEVFFSFFFVQFFISSSRESVKSVVFKRATISNGKSMKFYLWQHFLEACGDMWNEPFFSSHVLVHRGTETKTWCTM